MYKGRFESNKQGPSADEILRDRQKALETAEKQAAARAAAKAKPAAARPAAPKNMVTPAGAPAAPRANPKKAPQAPQKSGKRSRTGTLVFYSFYFCFIFLFFVCTFFGLQWLHGWLSDYEMAQPTVKSQEVFESLFTDPDWGALYDQSGTSGTVFEGKDTYMAYMSEKMTQGQLTFQETSAGLSGDKKYLVKLGNEKVAAFTLEDKGNDGVTDTSNITYIPDWQLGSVELFFNYTDSYRIQLKESHTAYVNGVALDDSYTIQIASTMAEDYLPMGTTGIRMVTQYVDGLMGTPTVTVQDENGQATTVIYDEAQKMFVEQTEANTISEEQKMAVLGAAKAYGKFMIEQASRGELARYFDPSSAPYKSITRQEKIVQKAFFASYNFTTEEVSDFCMYSEDLFSARANVMLNVTRKDDTTKETAINVTLFFERQKNGKWLAYEMTNEDVTRPVGKVRLTFMNGQEELASGFYLTDATELDTPMLSIPEGKVFSGWVRQTVNDQGQTVFNVVFTPDATGHVVLPAGSTLEPMVLHALFQNPEDVAAATEPPADVPTEAPAETAAATEAATEGEG